MYIFIFIVGILLVVASFVLPEQLDKSSTTTTELVQEGLSELLEREMDKIKDNTDDVASEAAKLAALKAVKEMEKLSDEKLKVVSDYSDTVMRDMEKIRAQVQAVHAVTDSRYAELESQTVAITEELKRSLEKKAEELEDSMTRKAEGLESTMAKSLEKKIEEAPRTMISAAVEESVEGETVKETTQPIMKETKKERDEFSFFQTKKLPTDQVNMLITETQQPVAVREEVPVQEPAAVGKAVERENAVTLQESALSGDMTETEEENARGGLSDEDFIDLSLDSDADKAKKSLEEKIWELHEKGKSKITIASELGIGMAEVRSAVQLYKELHE